MLVEPWNGRDLAKWREMILLAACKVDWKSRKAYAIHSQIICFNTLTSGSSFWNLGPSNHPLQLHMISILIGLALGVIHLDQKSWVMPGLSCQWTCHSWKVPRTVPLLCLGSCSYFCPEYSAFCLHLFKSAWRVPFLHWFDYHINTFFFNWKYLCTHIPFPWT